MNKKHAIILIVFIVAAAASLLFYNYYNEPYRKCLREMNSGLKAHKAQYLKGNVIINFKDNVPKEGQVQIIQSYNYTIVYRYSKNSALVKVPPNQEIQSMCRLAFNQQVESEQLNEIFNLNSFNR